MRALALALLLLLAGCDHCIQDPMAMFPRCWNDPKVDPDGPESFTADCKAHGCRPVMYGTAPGCDCTPDAGPPHYYCPGTMAPDGIGGCRVGGALAGSQP